MPLSEASHLEHQSETLVFESDWLASRPFFYNERTGRSGANINEVIDLVNVEIDPEGFNDYLDFGFSVFGRTPVRDVRMLRHSSRLWSGPSGLRVEHLPDPTLEGLEEQSSVEDVLELASARINDAAAGAAGDLVVPTSGGYDSRFINVLLSDKRRVRAFTYGTSDRPEECFEVVKAKELARRLGIRWELVPLGGFHQRLDAWDALYGVSTHAHGMYHLEFYDFIRSRTAAGSVVFTGSCGDWFNGSPWPEGETGRLDRPDDVYALLRWGPSMSADSAMSRLQSERRGAQEFLESDPRLRTQYRPRLVAACRLRIALLSYLVRAPEAMGFDCVAPFTDANVGMAMLKLPEAARYDRRWEREFFVRQGVDLENTRWNADSRNTLNFQAMRRVPLRPLDVALLREVVKPDYVRWINRTVGPVGQWWEVYWRLGLTPGFRRWAEMMRRLGVTEQRLPAYAAYLTLRPIEALLRRRDAARNGHGS